MTMLPEDKKIWTDALRSGEFKQCKDVLENSEYKTNCCLGVAGRVLGPKYGYDMNQTEIRKPDGHGEFEEFLCEKFANKIGLDILTQETLSYKNDGIIIESESFEQIAEWIDRNL